MPATSKKPLVNEDIVNFIKHGAGYNGLTSKLIEAFIHEIGEDNFLIGYIHGSKHGVQNIYMQGRGLIPNKRAFYEKYHDDIMEWVNHVYDDDIHESINSMLAYMPSMQQHGITYKMAANFIACSNTDEPEYFFFIRELLWLTGTDVCHAFFESRRKEAEDALNTMLEDFFETPESEAQIEERRVNQFIAEVECGAMIEAGDFDGMQIIEL